MKISNDYAIHKTQQIIDINNGLKQFSASVQITSENENDEFDILVVTHEDLDNIDFNNNYKRVTHFIEIKVESDENNNHNYVLVIKSETPTNVNITMDLEEKTVNPVSTKPNPIQNKLPTGNRKPPKQTIVSKIIGFIKRNLILIDQL